LCRRAAQAGYGVFFIPDAEVLHIGGACSKTRDDKSFDESGAQVMSFRMRSEYLYFRKHHGLCQVLANATIEMAWFMLRWLANYRPGPNRRKKRSYCRTVVSQTWKALKDTRCGRVSPPAPW
ncbi:MAG: glycosyltransferase family 2 protein, partial [Lentisphaerae bacterium]|nr:glycosyltransferase family 2 protein [Lentisphaerota bacterium]